MIFTKLSLILKPPTHFSDKIKNVLKQNFRVFSTLKPPIKKFFLEKKNKIKQKIYNSRTSIILNWIPEGLNRENHSNIYFEGKRSKKVTLYIYYLISYIL